MISDIINRFDAAKIKYTYSPLSSADFPSGPFNPYELQRNEKPMNAEKAIFKLFKRPMDVKV